MLLKEPVPDRFFCCMYQKVTFTLNYNIHSCIFAMNYSKADK